MQLNKKSSRFSMIFNFYPFFLNGTPSILVECIIKYSITFRMIPNCLPLALPVFYVMSVSRFFLLCFDIDTSLHRYPKKMASLSCNSIFKTKRITIGNSKYYLNYWLEFWESFINNSLKKRFWKRVTCCKTV